MNMSRKRKKRYEILLYKKLKTSAESETGKLM